MRFTRLCRLACVGLTVAASLEGQSPAFLDLEAKAAQAVAVLMCNSAAGHAADAGRFGSLDPSRDLITCLSEGERRTGVAFELGPPGSRIRRPRLVDLERSQVVTTAFDTVRFAQEIIAMIGASRYLDASEAQGTLPLVLRTAGDTIEVVYIPASQVTAGVSWIPRTVGGESSVIVAPDGSHFVRRVPAKAPIRQFQADTTKLIVVRSEADELPSLSEMMACLQMAEAGVGRGVAIETRRWTYVRLGTGWVVSPR